MGFLSVQCRFRWVNRLSISSVPVLTNAAINYSTRVHDNRDFLDKPNNNQLCGLLCTMESISVNSQWASSIRTVGAEPCCRIWRSPQQGSQGPQTACLRPDTGHGSRRSPVPVHAPWGQSPSLQAETKKHSSALNTAAFILCSEIFGDDDYER